MKQEFYDRIAELVEEAEFGIRSKYTEIDNFAVANVYDWKNNLPASGIGYVQTSPVWFQLVSGEYLLFAISRDRFEKLNVALNMGFETNEPVLQEYSLFDEDACYPVGWVSLSTEELVYGECKSE